MSVNTPEAPLAPPPPAKPKLEGRRLAMIGVGAVVGIGLAWFGGKWWIDQQNFVSTNDAFVKSDIVAVSAKVGGRIAAVHLATGQIVKQGEPAVELDDTDVKIQVRQAEANLAAAKAGLGSAQTSVSLQSEQTSAQRAQAAAAVATARRNWEVARVARDRAALDVTRNQKVYDAGGVSRQQLDTVKAALATAEAQLAAAASGVQNAQAGAQLAETGQTQVTLRERQVDTSEAQIGQAEASVAAARQMLANTRVVVPSSGRVARVPVNLGEMIQPGQMLAQVVVDGSLRVEAYLEETKIQRVRVGQPVHIDADAFSGNGFTGKVTDVGAATGSEFALIPANNASGNFTKVVQRVPVRIAVDDPEGRLKPGMSVTVHVDVREQK